MISRWSKMCFYSTKELPLQLPTVFVNEQKFKLKFNGQQTACKVVFVLLKPSMYVS